MKIRQELVFTKTTGTKVRGYYIDGLLKANLDFLRKQVENKWDGVGIICGQVGVGKTTLAQMIAYTLDPTFNLDRIVFSGKDLMIAIDKASKGQCIIFDEAVMSLSSQDFATDLQKTLIKKFTMIRSKNLYILLIIPSFFLMRRWFSIDRTKFMLYCYSPDGLTRGYFKFFSWNRKKSLYLKGYKTMDLECVSPNFRGRFANTEGFFINPEDYEYKKQEAIKALTEDNKKSDKEVLMEKFQDAKLRLELRYREHKERMREKYEVKYGKLLEKYQGKKQQFKSEVENLKQETIDLEKGKDRQKILELERELGKLVYGFYLQVKKEYEGRGLEFNNNSFMTFLTEKKIASNKWQFYKKFYDIGQELLKL